MNENPAHLAVRARRVVSGLDGEGKSTIVTDELSDIRAALPAFTLNELWRATSVPTTFTADDLGDAFVFTPPPGGVTVRLVTFAPDEDVDEAGYAATIDELMGAQFRAGGDQAEGMHAMATVDIDTVITGEIYCVFETGEETLLRAGDTIINRGTTHAWSNRSGSPATLVATIIPVAP